MTGADQRSIDARLRRIGETAARNGTVIHLIPRSNGVDWDRTLMSGGMTGHLSPDLASAVQELEADLGIADTRAEKPPSKRKQVTVTGEVQVGFPPQTVTVHKRVGLVETKRQAARRHPGKVLITYRVGPQDTPIGEVEQFEADHHRKAGRLITGSSHPLEWRYRKNGEHTYATGYTSRSAALLNLVAEHVHGEQPPPPPPRSHRRKPTIPPFSGRGFSGDGPPMREFDPDPGGPPR